MVSVRVRQDPAPEPERNTLASPAVRRYFPALDRLPPLQRRALADNATDIDAAGLPILADTAVGGRRVRFSLVVGQPRLRLTLPGCDPHLLGHAWNLDADPRLTIAEAAHTEWAAPRTGALLDTAAAVWARAGS